MKNQFYHLVSVVAIIGYFVPMLIVLIKKLWPARPFLLFAGYWMIGGLVNLIDFIPLTKRTTEIITVTYNMLDMPIVLGIFHFTTASVLIRRFTKIAAPALILLEVVNAWFKGMNYDALKYTLAVGLVVVLIAITWEIILFLQKIVLQSRERALLLIYAALLFEYGTYIVIYIFDYYLINASTTIDNFLVYYISSLVALTIAICGFLTKGLNKPQKPKEESFRKSFRWSGG